MSTITNRKWYPRAGDIVCVGDRRRFGFGSLVRIFTPEDRKFRLRHLRNAFNRHYCTHVCQVAQLPRGWKPIRAADGSQTFTSGDTFIKDTKARGLIPMPCTHYLRPNQRHQYLLAVISLEQYERSFAVRQSLNMRTALELTKEYSWKKQRYDYRGVLADFVPGFRWLRSGPHLKYCSERVRDDLIKDGARAPSGIISPHELYLWACRRGVVVYSEGRKQ